MKRAAFWSALVVCISVVVAALHADVKTREKTTLKFEGLLGTFINRMVGGSDGLTSTVTVKGNRLSRMNDTTGQIIDLSEEKIYAVDVRRKEYTVMTFAEMRKRMEEAKAELAKQQAQMNPEDRQQAEAAAKQLDYDVNVRETGQTKAIAGHDTREVVLTIAMRERGKTLDESGGLVMTSTLWLAPRVPALDEVLEFNVKFYKAVFGGVFSGIDAQQMNALSAIVPGIASLSEKMGAERSKLQGTALASTTVFEGVKSAEQVKTATATQPTAGGGLSGMLARRLGRGQTQPRTTVMTSTSETLSVAPAATDADVAIPAGFKEKK